MSDVEQAGESVAVEPAAAEDAAPAEPRVRADGLVDGVPAEPLVVRRRGRRVSTGPVDGASREPAPERHQSTENDDRLRGDKPPHWG